MDLSNRIVTANNSSSNTRDPFHVRRERHSSHIRQSMTCGIVMASSSLDPRHIWKSSMLMHLFLALLERTLDESCFEHIISTILYHVCGKRKSYYIQKLQMSFVDPRGLVCCFNTRPLHLHCDSALVKAARRQCYRAMDCASFRYMVGVEQRLLVASSRNLERVKF